jgi:hypothetical protein
MRIFLNLALTLVLSTQLVLPQQSKARSDSELAAITARGRMRAEQDVASRYATDAVVGLKPALWRSSQGANQVFGDSAVCRKQ